MRIIGLDVGEKTIGIAVSDELGFTAQGIEVIRRTNMKADIQRLVELINEYSIEKMVIGLPKNMNGTLGPRAEMVKKFADDVRKKVDLPIIYWDERLTTVSAEKTLIEADVSRKKRKKVAKKVVTKKKIRRKRRKKK